MPDVPEEPNSEIVRESCPKPPPVESGKNRRWYNFLADHPKVGLAMGLAAMAMAVSPYPKASVAGVIFFMVLALIVVIALIQEFIDEHGYSRYHCWWTHPTMAVAFFVCTYYLIHPPASTLKLSFADEVDPKTRSLIVSEIDSMAQYLRSIGFDIDDSVPPIALIKNGFPGVSISQSEFGDGILLPDPVTVRSIRWTFVNHFFSKFLNVATRGKDFDARRLFSEDVVEYYLWSYATPSSAALPATVGNGFIRARFRFGKNFTDKAIFFACKRFDEKPEEFSDLDFSLANDEPSSERWTRNLEIYFYKHVIRGFQTMDVGGQHQKEILELFPAPAPPSPSREERK